MTVNFVVILVLGFLFLNNKLIQQTYAENGDFVTKLKFHVAHNKSVSCVSGIGVGITFDGNNLWFSCAFASPDLFRADPHTGLVTANYSIAGGLGALAYDSTNNIIWAASSNNGNKVNVYLIHLSASKSVSSSSIAFSPPELAKGNRLIDGLAYDGQNHILYISPDTSKVIHKYDRTGIHLGDIQWAGDNNCYNSGVAMGGDLLYQGADGCNHVYVVNKSNPSSVVFDFKTNYGNDTNFRDEGIGCDSNTFSSVSPPKDVIWSVEAYEPRRAAAFEIPINSCGTGGQPPTPPSVYEVCPANDVQHWDKIIFEIKSPQLAKRLNLTANTELDIKVRDDPTKVSDIKQKVLNFLHVPLISGNITNLWRSTIQILNVDYAIVCAASGPAITASSISATPITNTQANATNVPSTVATVPKAAK